MKFENMDDVRRVLDALGEGLVVQDASGQIAYANAAAEKILGLEAPRCWASRRRTHVGSSWTPTVNPWKPTSTRSSSPA